MSTPLTRDFPDIIEYYDDEGFSHPTHIDDDAGFRYLANIYERVEPSEEFGTTEETGDDGRVYAAWNLICAGYCGCDQREEARRWLKDENCLYELNARHNDEFRKGFYTVINKFLTIRPKTERKISRYRDIIVGDGKARGHPEPPQGKG